MKSAERHYYRVMTEALDVIPVETTRPSLVAMLAAFACLALVVPIMTMVTFSSGVLFGALWWGIGTFWLIIGVVVPHRLGSVWQPLH